MDDDWLTDWLTDWMIDWWLDYEKDRAKTDTPILKRNMCQRNITKFISKMNMIDWQFVLNETDTQSAYTKFHEVISTKCNACFPYRKISKKYYKNKPWLSTALKESIKIKNKLYVKSKRSNGDENVFFYKKYRNKLNPLIRTTERKHFHDILLEHKSNLKKSWQVIKAVINKRKYNFNFNFKRLYLTQIYKGKAKTCVLQSNVWRPLLRYMRTACIRATKKIIDWMNFILHTIAYDQRNQTSYTDAQNLSQWRTVWIMGHEWFDVKRKYKGSGKSNSVQYKIYKPICRLYEIAGAC